MTLASCCLLAIISWTLCAEGAIPLPVTDSLFAWVRRQWLVEGTALLLVPAVIGIAVARRAARRGISWQTAWWLWMACAGFSVVYSIDRGLSVRSWVMFVSFGLLAWVAHGLVATPRDARMWVQFLVLVGCVTGLHGLQQYLHTFKTTLGLMQQLEAAEQLDVHGWTVDVFRDILVRKRIFSVFGWPNLFAGFLLLILPMAIGLGRQATSPTRRILWLLAAGLLGGCLVLTLSMGAWIAAILTGGVVWWFMRPSASTASGGISKSGHRLARVGVVVLLAIGVVWVTSYIVAKRARPYIASSASSRMMYVLGAVEVMRVRPWMGTGWGTFGIAYQSHMPADATKGQHTAIHAHNTLLEIGAELGVVGLGFALWFFLLVIRLAGSAIRSRADPEGGWIRWGLAVGCLAFAVHSLLEQTFFEGVTAPFWWITLGLLTGAMVLQDPGHGPRLRSGWIMPATLPLATAVMIAGSAVSFAVADANAALGGFLDLKGNRQQAVSAFEVAARVDPLTTRYPLEAGRRLARWANSQGVDTALRRRLLEQALPQFRRVTALSPWLAEGWYHLAVTCQALGQADCVLEGFHEAATRDPNSRLFALQLAQALGSSEHHQELIAAAQRYERLEPSDPKGWFLEAMAWQGLQRPTEAIRVYRQLVGRFPDHFAGWFNLAELLRQHGQPGEAAAAYARFLQVAPADQAAPRATAEGFLRSMRGS